MPDLALPLTVDSWTTLTLWVAGVYLVGVLLLLPGIVRRAAGTRLTAPEVVAGVLLVAVGVWLRFSRVPTLHGGHLTQDEAWIGRTYVGSIVGLEPVLAGTSDMTYALLLDTWYGIVGLSPLSARYFNATLGSLGLGLLFAALRRLVGSSSALWATVFLAISTYGVYFSTFAVEHVSALFFLPLDALLVARWLERPSPGRAVLLGLAAGASLFTFAGLVLGYVCLVCGWLLALVPELAKRGRAAMAGAPPLRAWAWAVVPFLVVVVAGITLHRTVYANARLFEGGGRLTPTSQAYREAIPLLLHEVFLGAHSWNLPFASMPFVERTLWPFVAVGVVLLWRRRPAWPWRGLALSAVLLLALLPLSGIYLGMRRGVYLLFPMYVLAGAGAAGLVARLGGVAGTLAVVGALALPLYHQFTFGWMQGVRSGFGGDFGAAPIPDAVLIDHLRQHDVVMSTVEFAHPWDRGRHVYFAKLAARHGLVPAGRTITFLRGGEPALVTKLAAQPDTVVLTWQPSQTLERMVRPNKLCFRWQDFRDQPQPGTPAALRLADTSHATHDDVCPWSGNPDRWLTSCARLGGRFPLSRLLHRFTCQNASCGPDRPEFVFVQPGSVSFALRRPPRGDGAVRLVIKARGEPAPIRANTVSVNGRLLGRMEGAPAQPARVFSFDVPPEADVGEVWSVSIGPCEEQGKVGLDVMWAALEPADGRPPGADGCPSRVCIGEVGGEVCEGG